MNFHQLFKWSYNMKFSTAFFVAIFLAVSVNGWHQKYGNDFITYSIGERYEQGVFKNI